MTDHKLENSSQKGGLKAVALISGGLDSSLASLLMKKLGIEIHGLHYSTPFCTCSKKVEGHEVSAAVFAKQYGIDLKNIGYFEEYIEVVKHPRFGYGKNMNPCIDCRIFFFKKAKEYMDEIGAFFLITGEVAGQRAKSQHSRTLMLIENEAGLQGRILRPLSAGVLPPTIMEEQGLIDRKKLLSITGKSRKSQIELAGELGDEGILCSSGGCRLTYKEFAKKLKDLFDHNEDNTRTIKLLRYGRHFRIDGVKFIVGKDEKDNKVLEFFRGEDLLLEAENVNSPICLLAPGASASVLETAAGILLRYSDLAPGVEGTVVIKTPAGRETLSRKALSNDEIKGYSVI